MESFGRLFILLGIVLIFLGLLMAYGDRLPFNLGKLPGDFHYQKGNFSFYFPLGTSLLISVLISLIFYLFDKLFR